MKPGLFFLRPLRAAFTLVEVLVSMSVLTLLLAIVAQMINSAAAVTAGSVRHLDTDSQARLVLDRMAVDFAQIVKRPDVDYYFQKNNGSSGSAMDDQMAFYSETSGYFSSAVTGPGPKSNVSLVGYRVRNRQLERLSKALVWNGVTGSNASASGLATTPSPYMMFLPQTLTGVWSDIAGNGADPSYQVLGESIFRLEISFLVRNATTNAKLSATPYLSSASTPAAYNGLHDVAAIVVSLAVLDDRSRLLVRSTDLDAAAAKLDDVTDASFASAPTTTPAKLWQAHVDRRDLAGALPPVVAGQVHVYERYFYLGNAQ